MRFAQSEWGFFKKVENRWQYSGVLYSPYPGAGNNFGSSVAMNETHLIVGENKGGFSKGRAYIFTIGNTGTPVLHANILQPDGEDGDYFGASVDISGLIAAVGAPSKKIGNKKYQGKVYTYRRDILSNIWLPLAHLVAPDGLEGDQFGSEISISGNYLAVSSPRIALGNQTGYGKVYIYQLNGNAWTHITTLMAPGTPARRLFGHSIQLQNDILIVGAPHRNGAIDDGNGNVYIYSRSGNNWILKNTLSADDGVKGDGFGYSVHMQNGTLIVGAPHASNGATAASGKAYIFKASGNNWNQQARLSASNAEQGDMLGRAVRLNLNTAVATAPRASLNNSYDNGRLYFFLN